MLEDLAGHYARLGKRVSLSDQPVPRFAFAPLALRRAVSNLVDNALRYAGEPIEIRSSFSNKKASIEVADRGPGIPAAEVERLKRPFTRLDASRAGPGSVGTKPPNARCHAADGGLRGTLNARDPVANGRSRIDSSLRPSTVVTPTSSEL